MCVGVQGQGLWPPGLTVHISVSVALIGFMAPHSVVNTVPGPPTLVLTPNCLECHIQERHDCLSPEREGDQFVITQQITDQIIAEL